MFSTLFGKRNNWFHNKFEKWHQIIDFWKSITASITVPCLLLFIACWRFTSIEHKVIAALLTARNREQWFVTVLDNWENHFKIRQNIIFQKKVYWKIILKSTLHCALCYLHKTESLWVIKECAWFNQIKKGQMAM